MQLTIAIPEELDQFAEIQLIQGDRLVFAGRCALNTDFGWDERMLSPIPNGAIALTGLSLRLDAEANRQSHTMEPVPNALPGVNAAAFVQEIGFHTAEPTDHEP